MQRRAPRIEKQLSAEADREPRSMLSKCAPARVNLVCIAAGTDFIKLAWKRDRLDDVVPVSQGTLEGEAPSADRDDR